MDPLAEYRQLTAELDRAIARLVAHHGARLCCRPGCADCCKPFSVLAIEAEAIRAALPGLAPALRTRIRAQADGLAQCPFCIDSLCAIYAHRPLICRSQGLAIAYVDHELEAIEVSACPLNFPDDFAFCEADLLLMDPFNSRLASLNRDFCAPLGIAAEIRLPLTEIAAALSA